jgi:hypothetical protein
LVKVFISLARNAVMTTRNSDSRLASILRMKLLARKGALRAPQASFGLSRSSQAWDGTAIGECCESRDT